uniref:Major facilitator superfamily (MFS) profile domain-containing protein n=1 Tax=Physcomitrium patens TaxID=3218 RepID=A0A7I4C083_PHYPA
MAGGGVVSSGGSKGAQYEGKTTVYVIQARIVAARGGLLFEYDIGISGGVTAMDDFLIKFFPHVYHNKHSRELHESHYCKYDDSGLQLYTSSLYLAGLVATFLASFATRLGGRKLSMFLAGIAFLSAPLSEMTPARLRGALNIMFQLAATVGILTANLIKYVNAEYEDMVEASEIAQRVEHPMPNILQKRNRSQLVMAIAIPFFQQVTGIMFYTPVLFNTIGFGQDASLYSAVTTGAVNVVATFVSLGVVDRWGCRVLFLEGGVQMTISQVIIAIILALKFEGTTELPEGEAVGFVILICIYVSTFAWSWGPLRWLVPSEIFPIETRSAEMSITIFLTILCHFEHGIFLFFAGWVVIMTIFIVLDLPETKRLPIEEMIDVWRRHWLWKCIMPNDPPIHDEKPKMTQ